MSIASEFKEFAVKGNVIDLAVGVIIGAAFSRIVDSLVKDIILPLFGAVFGKIDFSNMFVILGPIPATFKGEMNYADLTKAGVPLFAWGNFVTVFINFVILAFVIFLMVRQINILKRKTPVETVKPATPEDVLLLREIRDSLKNNAPLH